MRCAIVRKSSVSISSENAIVVACVIDAAL